MEGSLSDQNARIQVSRILVQDNVAKYMNRLSIERPEVFDHSINVAYLTAEIVLNPHFNELKRKDGSDYINDIITGALLHDIGKLMISNEILLKPGPLTNEEYRQCQLHTTFGYDMLKNDDTFSDVTKEIVLSHHEKVDGTGYPHHKKAEGITIETQIVSVCDIYDAVTGNRAYRSASDLLTAFKILACEPICLDVFLSLASCKDK